VQEGRGYQDLIDEICIFCGEAKPRDEFEDGLRCKDCADKDIEENHDWDDGFAQELTCDASHKWDFPVRMGQSCVCGEKEWGVDEV